MSYMYECRLDQIISWAENSEKAQRMNFNAITFIGIKENYEQYSKFTNKQEQAIDNVYFKFNIDKWSG